jgi:hypothetical protein
MASGGNVHTSTAAFERSVPMATRKNEHRLAHRSMKRDKFERNAAIDAYKRIFAHKAHPCADPEEVLRALDAVLQSDEELRVAYIPLMKGVSSADKIVQIIEAETGQSVTASCVRDRWATVLRLVRERLEECG